MDWPAWWIVRGSIPRQALWDKLDLTVEESPTRPARHYAVVMAAGEQA